MYSSESFQNVWIKSEFLCSYCIVARNICFFNNGSYVLAISVTNPLYVYGYHQNGSIPFSGNGHLCTCQNVLTMLLDCKSGGFTAR